jgi:hypothetical protein
MENTNTLIRGGDTLIRGGDTLIRGGDTSIRGGDTTKLLNARGWLARANPEYTTWCHF